MHPVMKTHYLQAPVRHKFIASCMVVAMSGCAGWSDPGPGMRQSVSLNAVPVQTGRSAELQQQITAMDVAAFGGQHGGLTLKLSYHLTLIPRNT